MADLSGFDANQHEPVSFEPLPNGIYTVCIVESEMKATQAGTGTFLSLTLQVLDGPYNGRKLFENLNLDNPSETAVQIAKGTLSAICRAIGIMTPSDSEQLHNRPLLATVRVTKRGDNGEPTNKISKYEAYQQVQQVAQPVMQPVQQQPMQQQVQQPMAQPTSPTVVEAPPWQNPMEQK